MLLAVTFLLLAQAAAPSPSPSPVPSPSPSPLAKGKSSARTARTDKTVCATRSATADPTSDPGMVLSVEEPLDPKMVVRNTCKAGTTEKTEKKKK